MAVKRLTSVPRALLSSRLGWRLARTVLGRPGVIVLMYHRVCGPTSTFEGTPVSLFRRQMRWLRERCTPIAPEQLPDSVSRSAVRPPMLVTFDDGYRDFHDHAFPILQEMGIPALVFLSTAFMDAGGLMWPDALSWAVLHTRRQWVAAPWSEERRVSLAQPSERRTFTSTMTAYLKGIPETEKQDRLFRLLADLDPGGDVPPPPRQMLTWQEVKATGGLIRFGGHSHTHVILSRVDSRRLDEEVGHCHERISRETGTPPRFFAYPNGQAGDFTSESKAVLKRYGFDVAFTALEGLNGIDTDWMEVRRFSGHGSIPQFAWFRGN